MHRHAIDIFLQHQVNCLNSPLLHRRLLPHARIGQDGLEFKEKGGQEKGFSRRSSRGLRSSTAANIFILQKPKLKVGKAKPKASNFTDTSFKAKSVVINKQSISVDAPSASSQFSHHVSLLKNRSDSQRAESLAYLTTAIAQAIDDDALPESISALLPRLLPLVVDGSNAVRQQLLKTLRVLGSRSTDIRMHADVFLLYVHAGMSHLSAGIRSFSTTVLDWLLDVAGIDVVTSAGGWTKTLDCFLSLLGWSNSPNTSGNKQMRNGWSSTQKPAFRLGNEGNAAATLLKTLGKFIQVGLRPPVVDVESSLSMSGPLLWHTEHHALPSSRNAFSYLGLFSREQREDEERLEDREARQHALTSRYGQSINNGTEALVKEGGEVGRAAAGVKKALADGLRDYDGDDQRHDPA